MHLRQTSIEHIIHHLRYIPTTGVHSYILENVYRVITPKRSGFMKFLIRVNARAQNESTFPIKFTRYAAKRQINRVDT